MHLNFPLLPRLLRRSAGFSLVILFAATLIVVLMGCGSEPASGPTQSPLKPELEASRPADTVIPTASRPADKPTPTSTPLPSTATPEPSPMATPQPEGSLVSLPEDEGPHETAIEWWYFNGFLWDGDGDEYSFHFVTFQSPTLTVGTPHLLHATLSDHQSEVHLAGERGALATLDPKSPSVDIDAKGWVMRGDGENYVLQFDLNGSTLELGAVSRREPVLHDSTGLVDLGEAGETYYYSRTRMELDGRLEDAEGRRAVSGSGWMDHQWGDISRVDVGWDWINLHLDDGSDLMVAVVRKPVESRHFCIDHPCGPPPAGERVAAYATYVDPDGTVTHVPGDGVFLEALYGWESPDTQILYPMGWRLLIDSLEAELYLGPVLPHAEFAAGVILPVVYWEGAVKLSYGSISRELVEGRGFVELVGYDPGQVSADIPSP